MQSSPFLELRAAPAPIFDSYDEDARHARAIREERQRELKILESLTGMVLPNEYSIINQSQQEAA